MKQMCLTVGTVIKTQTGHIFGTPKYTLPSTDVSFLMPVSRKYSRLLETLAFYSELQFSVTQYSLAWPFLCYSRPLVPVNITKTIKTGSL
jgi:hypothetical protein